MAKAVAQRAGILTPESVCLPHETFRELGAAAVMSALVARLGLPLMVKPARSGSALGCTVVRTAEELPSAMVNAFAYGAVALLERFVVGLEVAVPVIDDGSGPRVLPAVGILPDGGVYDYTARYTAGSTEFVTPAPLSDEAAAEVARVALRAHEALGLRDSRARTSSSTTRAVCGSSRSTSPPASPRPRPCPCRSRRPASTSARSVPPSSTPRPPAAPGVVVRDLTYPPIILDRQDRLPAARAALPDDRDRARAAHRWRAAGLNHIGYVDFIYGGLAANPSKRLVRFMAKRELFDHRGPVR